MSPHVLPQLLRLGEYELNKANFSLKHKHQRKDSSGRKRRIEYSCDNCDVIYITKLANECKKDLPWLCRSCRCKLLWKTEAYRRPIMSGSTNETRAKRSAWMSIESKRRWTDLAYREKVTVGLRNRPPDVYSRAKRSSKYTTIVRHWKTGVELVCTANYELAFVSWARFYRIDFDWQIQHRMPDGRSYIIDAFIKDGEFAQTWIEIKGYMREIGQQKWNWFHNEFPNSMIWNKAQLEKLQILVNGKPNRKFI
jgi:hypothetical protein